MFTRQKRIFIILLVTTFISNFAIAGEWKPYFGLLHSHTNYSDGVGTPDEAYIYAERAGLDFLALTDHNHDRGGGDDGTYLTQALYQRTKEASKKSTKKGKFIAICGQEFSTLNTGNTVNIFEASEVCTVDNGDFRELYENWLSDHPEVGFVQFNHPDYRKDQSLQTTSSQRKNDYGIDDYDNSFPALVEACGEHVYLIELINGPALSKDEDKVHFNGKHEKDYHFYLNHGFRLGVSVGQDNHGSNWGTSTSGRLGVWLKELTKENLFEALKNRRCYASEDENIQLKFTIKDKWMGDSVHLEPDEDAEIRVSISDPDEPKAKYTVKLFYDDMIGDNEYAKVVVERKDIEGDQDDITFTHQHEQGGYYFLKVTQRSSSQSYSDDVWTSPIWVVEADIDDVGKDIVKLDGANTFEDSRGRFVVDLPEKWKLEPQTERNTYIFKSGDGTVSIIIGYVPETNDRAKLFTTALNVFRASGVTDVAPEGEIKDLSVNGNPSRWGVYGSEMDVGGIKVRLYGLLGSVALKDGCIYFISILSQFNIETFREPMEKAFQSIRNVGQGVTGGSYEKTAAAAAVSSDEPTTFKHELLSLTLPPGWKPQKLGRDFGKEVVGWFMSDRILGGSLLAMCHKGMLMNQKPSKVFKAAKVAVGNVTPNAKLMKTYEQEVARRRKAQIVVYKGTGVSQGKEVPLVVVTATFKTSKCWVNLIGLSQASGGVQIEKQIVEIARSAR